MLKLMTTAAQCQQIGGNGVLKGGAVEKMMHLAACAMDNGCSGACRGLKPSRANPPSERLKDRPDKPAGGVSFNFQWIPVALGGIDGRALQVAG